jgi:hypothetical protein
MTSRALAPSIRLRGGSWMITTSPAPLMLLPENDVAHEAATSFPSLIAPDGLGCASADSSGHDFTGLFVGCAVISSHDETAIPSPWPLDITSSASLSHSCPDFGRLTLTHCASHAAVWGVDVQRGIVMQRGVWQRDRRALPAGSGFSNGILGSPSRRSLHAGKNSGDVASVYVTISPDAGGCSALLLVIGTSLPLNPMKHPRLFLYEFEFNFEHILLPFTLTAE